MSDFGGIHTHSVLIYRVGHWDATVRSRVIFFDKLPGQLSGGAQQSSDAFSIQI